MGHPAIDSIKIDRNSPVPLYYQLASHIEQAIAEGQVEVGDWLENEIELANRLGLSRPTVRSAIGELVNKGMLVRQRGIGTRVVSQHITRPIELTSLHDDLVSAGQTPTTEVISLEVVDATPEQAKEFGGASKLAKVTRVRSTEAGPLALMVNYLPANTRGLTEETLRQRGLYDLLRSNGVVFHHARQEIGATSADAAQAKMLQMAKGQALVTMQRHAYGSDATLIEYGDHVYRADRYKFAFTINAN